MKHRLRFLSGPVFFYALDCGDMMGQSHTGSRSMSEQKQLTSEEIVRITRQTNYGTWRAQKTWKPLHIVDAEDCYIIDGAGKRYLDFSSQLMCMNLGHKNKRVIESIVEQAREL